jgi:hypothetical protein
MFFGKERRVSPRSSFRVKIDLDQSDTVTPRADTSDIGNLLRSDLIVADSILLLNPLGVESADVPSGAEPAPGDIAI